MLYENDLFVTQEIWRAQTIDMVISYTNIIHYLMCLTDHVQFDCLKLLLTCFKIANKLYNLKS
jgi:hypothetical protein